MWEEDLGKDIVVASDFFVGVNKGISQVKVRHSARLLTKSTPGVKLPILELKVFSGDLLDWTGFWDIFKANIHEEKTNSLHKVLQCYQHLL